MAANQPLFGPMTITISGQLVVEPHLVAVERSGVLMLALTDDSGSLWQSIGNIVDEDHYAQHVRRSDATWFPDEKKDSGAGLLLDKK